MLPIQNPKLQASIDALKSIDIDGETMQYIIEEVGMKDQMLRQLIMQANSEHLLDLIVEKQEIDKC